MTVNPQITYYRDYQLKDVDFVDAKLQFSNDEEKQNFDLALYKKIFGLSENATSIQGLINYGIGDPNGRKYIFGTIYLEKYKKAAESDYITVEKAYIFIFGCKEQGNGILRAHQIVKIENTELKHDTIDNLGLFVGNNCIVGIKKEEDDKYYFYLPKKSFCLEGSHRDIIELPINYNGKIELTV